MPIIRDPPVTPVLKVTLFTDVYARYITDMDSTPLFESAISGDLLPSPGTQTTETERFRRHYIAIGNSSDCSMLVAVTTTGTLSRFTDTTSATYYYRAYLATGVTSSSPPIQPTSWGEVMVVDRSTGAESTAGWYDDLTFSYNTFVTLFPGYWLWIRLRGTSWCPLGYRTSIGFKRGNVMVRLVV